MPNTISQSNKALVQASFDRWREGTGSPFELLAPEADWTIVGSSPLSKTYPNKQAFLEEAVAPIFDINARESVPTSLARGRYEPDRLRTQRGVDHVYRHRGDKKCQSRFQALSAHADGQARAEVRSSQKSEITATETGPRGQPAPHANKSRPRWRWWGSAKQRGSSSEHRCCGSPSASVRPTVVARPPPIPKNPDETPAARPTASNDAHPGLHSSSLTPRRRRVVFSDAGPGRATQARRGMRRRPNAGRPRRSRRPQRSEDTAGEIANEEEGEPALWAREAALSIASDASKACRRDLRNKRNALRDMLLRAQNNTEKTTSAPPGLTPNKPAERPPAIPMPTPSRSAAISISAHLRPRAGRARALLERQSTMRSITSMAASISTACPQTTCNVKP